ncbi:MAG: PLP-dependent aminotransferase family protein, partial [Acholeplasmataceae bacterium]|nr:PLP-dependent aminotransferase family protein [Acholeplasmataceae bacterium]
MGLSVESLIKSRANIVHITPSHQFPTGIVMPIQRRYELLNWANLSLNRYIIEDDYDSEFRFQGKPIPALQGIDKNETVIYMNTFTKTLAPSFRMSYMVIPRKLVLKYQELMTYHGCTVPNFEQYIMYKFMHEGFFERHINRMRKSYRQKIETIIKMVEGREWLRLKAYDTGLHFLMEVETEITEEQLVKKAKENHIDVTGLKSYNHSGQMNHHPTLVIGYSGLKSEDIEEAISLLIKVVTPNTLKDKRD